MRTRGYVKGKSRNIICGLKLDLDGRGAQGQEKGNSTILKDLASCSCVPRSFVCPALSSILVSLRLSSHSSFQPLFYSLMWGLLSFGIFAELCFDDELHNGLKPKCTPLMARGERHKESE